MLNAEAPAAARIVAANAILDRAFWKPMEITEARGVTLEQMLVSAWKDDPRWPLPERQAERFLGLSHRPAPRFRAQSGSLGGSGGDESHIGPNRPHDGFNGGGVGNLVYYSTLGSSPLYTIHTAVNLPASKHSCQGRRLGRGRPPRA
jgi:hypothetical protein